MISWNLYTLKIWQIISELGQIITKPKPLARKAEDRWLLLVKKIKTTRDLRVGTQKFDQAFPLLHVKVWNSKQDKYIMKYVSSMVWRIYIPWDFHQTMTFQQNQTAVEKSLWDSAHPGLAEAKKSQILSSHVSSDALQRSKQYNLLQLEIYVFCLFFPTNFEIRKRVEQIFNKSIPS